MRRGLLLLLASFACHATNFTCTSTKSGNVSDPTVWSTCNSGIPDNNRNAGVDFYIVVIATGHSVAVDTSVSWGSSAAQIGNAFTVNGTNIGTQGTLTVNRGVTLTTAGRASTCTASPANTAGAVAQWGNLVFQPGSTWIVDSSSDANLGCIAVNGTILADATGDTPIVFTIPAAYYTWGNALGSTAATPNGNGFGYEPISGANTFQVFLLTKQYISNAAGTGLGSCTDTSLSLSMTVGSPMTELCLPDPVPGSANNDIFAVPKILGQSGTYVVDYRNGVLIANTAASTRFNYTLKYLTQVGAVGHGTVLNLPTGQAHASGIFRNVNIQHWGMAKLNVPQWVPIFTSGIFYGTGNTTDSSRVFEVTNSRFEYTDGAICMMETGLAADPSHPILISNNFFTTDSAYANGGQPYSAILFLVNNTANSFNNITIQNNVCLSAEGCLGTRSSLTTAGTANNIIYDSNFHRTETGLAGPFSVNLLCNDCIISNNQLASAHGTVPVPAGGFAYSIPFQGGIGHPLVFKQNKAFADERGAILWSYTESFKNEFYSLGHHCFVMGNTSTQFYLTNINVYNNICSQGASNPGASVNFGYLSNSWVENAAVYHNTFINRGTSADGYTIGLCDTDAAPHNTNLHVTIRDNLSANFTGSTNTSPGIGRSCVTPTCSVTTRSCKVGIDTLQNNAIYGVGGTYALINRGAVITKGGSNYNTTAKNITGLSIWNPSYSSNQSGSAAKLTWTSASNMTLSWSLGGSVFGTAQQLNWSGAGTTLTLTSAPTFDGAGSPTVTTVSVVLTVSGATWTLLPSVPSTCPLNNYVKFTSGVAAGQIAAIVANTATTLTVLPPHYPGQAWDNAHGGMTPALGDSFVILQAEVTLPDEGSGSVTGSPDYRLLPASTQTDTGISIAMTDYNGTDAAHNPTLLSPLTLGSLGQYAPTNYLFCTAASDGTTVGAVPCAIPSGRRSR